MLYFAIALLIVGVALIGLAIYFDVVKLKAFKESRAQKSLKKENILRFSLVSLLMGGGFISLLGALFLGHGEWASITQYSENLFKGEPIYYGLQLFLSLFGSLLFGFSLNVLIMGAYLHFKKDNYEGKKLNDIIMYSSIATLFAGFYMWTSGIGPYLSYPLINSVDIGSSGFFAARPGESTSGLRITFYACFILLGFFVCYLIAKWNLFKRYGKNNILDTLAIVAFFIGIIGTRVWYVVGNWDREFASQPFYTVFQIWNGGLTVLGGVFLGILGGVIFLRITHPEVDWKWAVDVIVPTILLAQAVGRWGNFFNVEVYGGVTSVEGWRWLPNWVLLNMNTTPTGAVVEYLDPGYIHTPLFIVESLCNLAGYFLIRFGVRVGLKKITVPGDGLAAYFIWYGTLRLILEPLRDSTFNMGVDDQWSIVNSVVYILLGVRLLFYFHMGDLQKKGKAPRWLLPSLIFLFEAFVLFCPFMNTLTMVGKDSVDATMSTELSGFALMFEYGYARYIVAYVFMACSVIAYILFFIFYMKMDEKKYRLLLWIAQALSVVGGLIFLLGKIGLPRNVDGLTEVTYSSSFGVAFATISMMTSFALGTLIYWPDFNFRKKTEEPVEEAVEENKDE